MRGVSGCTPVPHEPVNRLARQIAGPQLVIGEPPAQVREQPRQIPNRESCVAAGLQRGTDRW